MEATTIVVLLTICGTPRRALAVVCLGLWTPRFFPSIANFWIHNLPLKVTGSSRSLGDEEACPNSD
jgi:hypothetical protein